MGELGHRIAKLRTDKGLSLQQTANLVGVTKSHIWDLEKGYSSNPSLSTLLALSRTFGVTIGFLAGVPDVLLIKPLNWDRPDAANPYSVSRSYRQGPKPFFLAKNSRIIGWYDTQEGARSAAQSDFDSSIAAIVSTSHQPTQGAAS